MDLKITKLLDWSNQPENNIRIKNYPQVLSKLLQINKQKTQHLHLIADFDMTLTKYWYNGKRSLSSHGVLEESSVFDQDVKNQMRQLYLKYYPIEISHVLSLEEK